MSDAVHEAELLRAELRALRRGLAQLEARLDRLERADPVDEGGRHERTALTGTIGAVDADGPADDQPAGGSVPVPAPVGPASVEPAPPAVTDRRQLLGRAATVAAGAVAGGTALALGQASPAAALPGTFDGNPAVTAVASPSSGVAVSATSTSGSAVSATTTTGTGVAANAGAFGFAVKGTATSSGTGVQGLSQSGYAVQGLAETGIGASGTALSGTGLYGYSSTGTGLDIGSSSGWAIRDYVGAGGTHLVLAGLPAPPPSTTVNRDAGSIVRDTAGDLWYSVASGAPGTWRKLSGPGTAGALHILPTPVRVYDSRPGNPPAVGLKSPLAAGVARSCDLKANGSGVPAGATAVLVGLTVTNTTGAAGGFLAVYRNGIAWPGTSSLNWSAPNQNVAVTTVTAVDANAECSLFANQATNVVVDVLGYYR